MTVAPPESSSSADFAPTYELAEAQVAALSEQLFKERPPLVDDRFVCYRFDSASSYANLGRNVERTVFENSFGNTAANMHEAYGPYEAASEFFVNFDQETHRPVGALRIIKNSPSGLKTLNDITDDPLRISLETFRNAHKVGNLDDCWDVGSVAVLPEYRAGAMQASIQLYRALYVSALDRNIKHLVSVIDKKPYEMMRRVLGIPFVPIAGSKYFSYLGSTESRAVYGEVDTFYKKMSRRERVSVGVGRIVGKDISDPLSRLVHGKTKAGADSDRALLI
ncbi:MAG: hypothetical protein WC498_00625 [Candidatus Saccharimonadales bacterium]